MRSHLRPLVAPGVLAVALAATWLGLLIGGGAQPLSVDDPGPLVRFGLPFMQVLVDLSAALTLGPLVLAVFSLTPEDARWRRLMDVAAGAAGTWAVSALASGVLAASDTLGIPIGRSDFGVNCITFLTSVTLGNAWLGTAMLAAALTVLCIGVRSHSGAALLTVLAVVSLVPMSQQGHAASVTSDHDAAISALFLHVTFAAVWLGGLMALVIVARTPGEIPIRHVVERYSTIALLSFLIVALSGVLNASIRLGTLAALVTGYGCLVSLKTLALLLAGVIGALHRRVVIRRITEDRVGQFYKLMAVELFVLAVASGLAAALARTPTPVPATSANVSSTFTPAQILTGGQSLPPAPTLMRVLATWQFDPLWVCLTFVLATFYTAGVVRLYRRGDRWPIHRTVLWMLGMLLLFALTSGGLNTYEKFLFSAHMLMHMLLAMVVPLLLVPAAPVTLALRTIHMRSDGTRGGREWILLIVRSRVANVFANPVVAAALFVGSLVLFYYSPLFSWSMTDHLGHEWMTAHFLITGYVFVQSLVGVDPLPHRWSFPLRLLVLLATMAFHAFFGLGLMNGNGLLLANWFGAMGWGTSAIDDQKLGGGIAWSVGEVPTLVLALLVATMWARSDERDSIRLDRAAARDGDKDLVAYNLMLHRLSARSDRSADDGTSESN